MADGDDVPVEEVKTAETTEDVKPEPGPEPDSKEAVLAYVRARIRADAADEKLAKVTTDRNQAMYDMQEAWRQCKCAAPGIYSFKEMGRTCVVVSPNKDYPELVRIVE